MSTLHTSSLLRQALLADAAASAAMGLLLALAGRPLGGLLDLPHGFLLAVGLICLIWAVAVGRLAGRDALPRAAGWAVIAVNAVWVVESFLLLLTGWLTPNGLGYAFVIGQALVVLVLLELQWLGLRRSEPVAAAA